MVGRISAARRRFTGALSVRGGGAVSPEQIYAAFLLPAFIVFSIVLAKAGNTILLAFMPDSVAAISALRVILGTLLVIGTGAAWILWVRTGGFGLFA